MTFKQAMIVPTMVTLGCGALLLAQNLSLIEVSYAAPAAEGSPASAKRTTAPTPAPGSLSGATGTTASANNPEFGTGTAVTGVLRAMSDAELAKRAVEASGREDPFMALLPPDPSTIVPPPVTFAPPSLTMISGLPGLPGMPKNPVGGAKPKPAAKPKPVAAATPTPIADLPFSGEKAPAASEPQWIVRGIMSTGAERVTLLEGKDDDIHAHVGDVLADGSRVEAISNRGVTFIRNGRRFVKQIGGNN